MTATTTNQDPLEFLKGFWENLGFPLPGMVAPTVDTDELGKRIADLKAVEGWLKSNLSMLQMTIQGLEMQRATLMALQTMGQQVAESETGRNPFLDAALWPWNMMPTQVEPVTAGAAATEAPADHPKRTTSPRKRKPKG